MRGRSLAVMAALVLALGAFIWLYERELPTTAERETQGKRVFGDLEADEVREVTIEQGGRTVRLVREAPAPGAESEEAEAEEEERARRRARAGRGVASRRSRHGARRPLRGR